MNSRSLNFAADDPEWFWAGSIVPPGLYIQVAGPRRIVMETSGVLPTYYDGRVELFERATIGWSSGEENTDSPAHANTLAMQNQTQGVVAAHD